MTKRIVLATLGSHGDIHPYIALGQALAARGFDVVAATSGHFRADFAKAGLAFAAIGPTEAEVCAAMRMTAPELFRHVLADDIAFMTLAQDWLARVVADVTPILRGADLALVHRVAFGAQIAAEQVGAPQIDVILAPSLLFSAYDPPFGVPVFARGGGALRRLWNHAWIRLVKMRYRRIGRRMLDLRATLGLPATRAVPLIDPGPALATIGLFSPLLAPPQPDFPPQTHIVGATFHDGGGALSPQVEAFLAAGPPPLVATLGSFAALDGGDVLRAGVEAARALKRRLLIVAGREEARDLGVAPGADLLICGYAPHSLIFPRAEAVIHHGGAGTMAQALRAGKPQLIAPFFADQPDNAGRAELLGVARVLPRRQFSPRRATAELRLLLETAGYARKAKEIAPVIAAEDGAAAAARLVEDMVNGT